MSHRSSVWHITDPKKSENKELLKERINYEHSEFVRKTQTYNFLSEEIEPIYFFDSSISHVLISVGDKGLPPEGVCLSQVKLDYLTMRTHQVIQRDFQLYSHSSVNQPHKVNRCSPYLEV
jgi:hypothetical protein